ncbi:MAG TPA: M56 family metallopeptidase [Bacteroidales bacterium]|nr:M56 family metallopeptidase [Bacteroidales bacterium]
MDLKHYLIYSNICLVISFLLFRLLNRDETMFRQQRMFILLSVFLSLALPFTAHWLQLPQPILDAPATGAVTLPGNIFAAVEHPGKTFSYGRVVFYSYLVITILFLLNILYQVARVFLLYLSSSERNNNIIHVNGIKMDGPFSFFRWIFIPANRSNGEELKSIIIHESVHAREFHTMDNIILEISCAIMWFNPVIWLMKKSLHLIHEYIADEGTLEKGIEKTIYQSLLVNQVAEEKLISINPNFNNNNLRKRIIMMTMNKKEGHNTLNLKKLIPLSALILAVSILQSLVPVEVKAQEKAGTQIRKVQSEPIVVTGYGKQDSIPGNIRIRSTGSDNTLENTLFIIDGKDATREMVESLPPDKIESISVFRNKDQIKVYTEKDYDGVIVIATKQNTQGSNDKSQSMKTVVVTGYGSNDTIKSAGVRIRSTGESDIKNTLYIINDKEVSRNEFENLQSDQIKSITVIKNKDQMAIYTKKDYDGVIVVVTK